MGANSVGRTRLAKPVLTSGKEKNPSPITCPGQVNFACGQVKLEVL